MRETEVRRAPHLIHVGGLSVGSGSAVATPTHAYLLAYLRTRRCPPHFQLAPAAAAAPAAAGTGCTWGRVGDGRRPWVVGRVVQVLRLPRRARHEEGCLVASAWWGTAALLPVSLVRRLREKVYGLMFLQLSAHLTCTHHGVKRGGLGRVRANQQHIQPEGREPPARALFPLYFCRGVQSQRAL